MPDVLLTITDVRDLSDRQLLIIILERLDTMNTAIQSETAAEAVLSAKVDLLLTAFAAGKAQVGDLSAQIATLQAQVAQLLANGSIGADDAAALTAATTDMAAKAAAIDTALTPPVPPTDGAVKAV